MNLKLTFWGGEICHLICLSCQSRHLSVWILNCHFLKGTSSTWSAWAVRVGIYQYESQIDIFWVGRSATWSAWALWVGIYQYESQITIFWEGSSASWSTWAVTEKESVSMRSQIAIFCRGRSATWSAWALRVGIYQYESQIDIFWGIHLPLNLPELSE